MIKKILILLSFFFLQSSLTFAIDFNQEQNLAVKECPVYAAPDLKSKVILTFKNTFRFQIEKVVQPDWVKVIKACTLGDKCFHDKEHFIQISCLADYSKAKPVKNFKSMNFYPSGMGDYEPNIKIDSQGKTTNSRVVCYDGNCIGYDFKNSCIGGKLKGKICQMKSSRVMQDRDFYWVRYSKDENYGFIINEKGQPSDVWNKY